jgi:MFS family permease
VGLAYVRRQPEMLAVLLLVVVLSTFCFNFNVILPVLAKTTLHGNSMTFGVLSALFGAGALAGALTAAAQRRATMSAMIVGGFLFTALELLLAPARSTLLAGLLLLVCGFGFTVWTSNSNSSLQLQAPDHLRGRVVGLYFYAFNGSGPLGGILVGWLCARGGTELALALGGAVGLAGTAVTAARLRAVRRGSEAVDGQPLERREPARAA